MNFLYTALIIAIYICYFINTQIYGENKQRHKFQWKTKIDSKIDSVIHNNLDLRKNQDAQHISYKYDYDFNAYITNYISWSSIFSYKGVALHTKISHVLHLGTFSLYLYENPNFIDYSPLIFESFFLKYQYKKNNHSLQIYLGRFPSKLNKPIFLIKNIEKRQNLIDGIMIKWNKQKYGDLIILPIQILSLSSLLSTPANKYINYQEPNKVNNLKLTFSFASQISYKTANLIPSIKKHKLYLTFKSIYALLHSSPISGQDILRSNIANPLKGDKDWIWNNQISLYSLFQQGWLIYGKLEYTQGHNYIAQNNTKEGDNYYIFIQGISLYLNIQTPPLEIDPNYKIKIQTIGTYNSGNTYDRELRIQKYGFINLETSSIGGLIFNNIRGSLASTSLVNGNIIDTPHQYTRSSSSASIAVFLHQKVYQRFEFLISLWGIWDTNKILNPQVDNIINTNNKVSMRFGQYIGIEINLRGTIQIYDQWKLLFESGIFVPGKFYQITHENPHYPFGTSPSWAIKMSSQVHFDYQTN